MKGCAYELSCVLGEDVGGQNDTDDEDIEETTVGTRFSDGAVNIAVAVEIKSNDEAVDVTGTMVETE